MFCKEMTEPIKLFLLPALSVSPLFPFQHMVKTLNNTSLPESSWMLYCLLFLEQQHICMLSFIFKIWCSVSCSCISSFLSHQAKIICSSVCVCVRAHVCYKINDFLKSLSILNNVSMSVLHIYIYTYRWLHLFSYLRTAV